MAKFRGAAGGGPVCSFCRGYFCVLCVDVCVLDVFGLGPAAVVGSRVAQVVHRMCFARMRVVCCVFCVQMGLCEHVS